MRQEFRPGDRVRADFNPERVCFVVPDDPYHLFTASFANGVGAAITLVARPVYPEPGQVAVLLDAELLRLLDEGKWLLLGARISDIVDDAREASRP